MKIKITPAQENNLRKLIKYLRGELKAQFDMTTYSDLGDGQGRNEKKCGSVGCVIGHAPYAGIRKCKDEFWHEYSERKFGLPLESDEWDWCFSTEWHRTDNTPTGAAARIERLLTKGLPRNWREQMYGNAPLGYGK